MTDNEIIKALMCCMQSTGRRSCGDCPLTDKECIKGLPRLALDLINRQQEKIERVQANKDKWEEIAIILDQSIRDKDATIERLQKHYHKVCEHTQKVEMELAEKELDTSWFNNPNTHRIPSTIRKIRAEVIKEFADLVSAEINRALTNNHKVKQERISKLIEQGIAYNDEFCNYCDGKIHALCGIGDFIQNLVKEMVGEE